MLFRSVVNKVDIENIENIDDNTPLQLNEIGKVSLKTAMPIFTDDYRVNRISGSIILVDEATNETVAAGMIR